MEENKQAKEKAGCFALGFSFIFPIIGIILYFVNRKTVENASAYLYAAGSGIVLGLILQAFAAATMG